ncbi:hypothetical protein M514_01854 [Trichuris suis]|uniref:Uncharacterized protein n=1 Tax=Trichuris suis TaxID=68888 RepID=A0A085NTD1_9BILA|nr:hypothetical protein M513_01854 [Trichuris suis]KFD72727.1 hypothetical protein M514_01854 [Trichuris suis]
MKTEEDTTYGIQKEDNEDSHLSDNSPKNMLYRSAKSRREIFGNIWFKVGMLLVFGVGGGAYAAYPFFRELWEAQKRLTSSST